MCTIFPYYFVAAPAVMYVSPAHIAQIYFRFTIAHAIMCVNP